MNMLKNNKGFTLVELIVVLCIALMVVGPVVIYFAAGKGERTGEATIQLSDGSKKYCFVQIPDEGLGGGVCAGMAYKWGIPTWVPRAGFIVTWFFGGSGVVLYLLCCMGMDEVDTPDDFHLRTK